MNWVFWLGVVGLFGLTLFSTLNLALRAPARGRVADEFDRRGRADAFDRFVARLAQYLLTTAALRSATVLMLFVSVLDSFHTAQISSDFTRVTLGCVVAWAFLLIFGVAIPYAWADYSSPWLLVRFLPLLEALRILCYPLIVFLGLFDPVVRRLVGAPVRDPQSFADQLEQGILDAVSEGELHGAVDEQEKEMIESVMELGDTCVAEIMTPRTDVVALPASADRAAVVDALRAHGHSRLPVYDGTIDTISGIVYVKDLLGRAEDAPFDLRGLTRKAFFIPESKPVRDLLRDFQREKVHIAVVLDEYGGTAGLVTIEDILEELVGDIADEYEAVEPATLKQIGESTYEVDARMRIDDLNDQLQLGLPDNRDYETIGGFVFSTLGKIPLVGESCECGNVGIQVLAADPRRVTRILLKVGPPLESPAQKT